MQPLPSAIRQAFAQPLPIDAQGAERTCRDVRDLILPHAIGNTHPRFFGWVHGCGSAGGMLAELVAAGSSPSPAHLHRRPPRLGDRLRREPGEELRDAPRSAGGTRPAGGAQERADRPILRCVVQSGRRRRASEERVGAQPASASGFRRSSPSAEPSLIARMLSTQRSVIATTAWMLPPAQCGVSSTLSSWRSGEAAAMAPPRRRRARRRRSCLQRSPPTAPPRRPGRRARC